LKKNDFYDKMLNGLVIYLKKNTTKKTNLKDKTKEKIELKTNIENKADDKVETKEGIEKEVDSKEITNDKKTKSKKFVIDKTAVKFIFQKISQYVRANILLLTFVLTSVINATLLRHMTINNALYIKPMIADITVVLIIASFAYFIRPRYRIYYFFTFACILSAVCIINAIYFKNFFSFSSVTLLSLVGELGGYTNALTENILEAKDFIYLWQLFVLIVVHFGLKKTKDYEKVAKTENYKISFLNTIIVSLITLGFFVSMLTSTDLGRLKKQWSREFVVQEFGIYTYQINDIYSALRAKLNSMFGYDEAARNFREYYANVSEVPISTNEYTDIFKGKNVIVIHAESIQNFLISDQFRNGEPTRFNGIEVTPNLNKLASEGIYFNHFYAQESSGTSSDTEFTFNTSLLPASSGTVFMNYFKRDYVTIPKMLGEMGYYTFSMHGNKGSAWNRNVVHPKLGYQRFYSYNDYDVDEVIGLGLSDKSFFSQSVDYIKEINAENDLWYGVLIMLTNHTPFSDINNYEERTGNYYDVDYKYEVVDEDGNTHTESAPYMTDTKLGNYFKSAHYADEAIGELIEKLDSEGLLDNTVIIIYGDHDNKQKRKEYNRFYNYNYLTDDLYDKDDPEYIDVDEYFYEINRSVPFIIWSKDLASGGLNNLSGTYEKVMGMIDVQPTLGNMLGFYNKYALGHDIFSIDENVVVFPSSNWITDKIYYNSAKGSSRQLKLNVDIPDDYISKNNEYAEQILTISNDIIVYDLIKRVGENSENVKYNENIQQE